MIPFLGETSALATALLWSGSAVVFGLAIGRLGSVFVNITRLLLAVLYLGVTILLFGLQFGLSGAQYSYLCISGIIGLTLGDSFLFKAFHEIGARISMLLMALSPAMAAALAFLFLGEVISPLGILGMVVTLAGIGTVVLERGEPGGTPYRISLGGVGYALLAAAGNAAGMVFAKLAFKEGPINGLVATIVRISAALLLLLPVAAMTGRYRRPVHTLRGDPRALRLLLLGSVLGPFLGISLSLVAVANTDVGIAATLMATVPILMLPLVRIVYGERLSWRATTGAFMAVTGVALLFLR